MQKLHILAATLLLSAVAAKTFPGDTAALRQLKAGLSVSSLSSGSCISSWNFAAGDPCASLFSGRHFTCGFRCDAVDRSGFSRVSDISLDSASYSGFLSPAVWALPFLRTLDLPDNQFHGSLPPPSPSAVLRHLRRVSLSRNLFSGRIPSFGGAFPALEELFLDENQFSGSIPPLYLPSLRRLEIQMNNLSGELPELRTTPRLLYLDGSDNSISGELPSSLPATLLQISLRSNLLRGPLSGDLAAALPNLQVLDLTGNRLSGEVPAALFEHPSLEQLALARNQFSALPSPPQWWWWWWRRRPETTSVSQLVAVDLGNNQLAGALPAGMIAAMPRLTSLVLENNRLSGMIPMEYAIRVLAIAAPPLERLVLSGNYICGVIPTPLMGLKEGDAMVDLADNCLVSCPEIFFFCKGAAQKQPSTCRLFNP